MFWTRQQPRTVFSTVLEKSLSEAIKVAVKALAVAATSSPVAGELMGAVSKVLIDALFQRVSAVDRKLDILLRIDLVAGIRHLRDGLQQSIAGVPRADTDKLFELAHEGLTRAWAVVLDSREDASFVRSVDAVSLAAHSSRRGLALAALAEIRADLTILKQRADLLRLSEKSLREHSASLDRFLQKDDWGDKPWGYQEQRLYARWVRDGLPARQAALAEADRRIEAIEGFVQVARTFLLQSEGIVLTSTS